MPKRKLDCTFFFTPVEKICCILEFEKRLLAILRVLRLHFILCRRRDTKVLCSVIANNQHMASLKQEAISFLANAKNKNTQAVSFWFHLQIRQAVIIIWISHLTNLLSFYIFGICKSCFYTFTMNERLSYHHQIHYSYRSIRDISYISVYWLLYLNQNQVAEFD